MKNIELKISLNNFSDIILALKLAGAEFKGKLVQTDTYYNCKTGRLKLREINNKDFELIFYKRPDKNGSEVSHYQIAKIEKNQLRNAKIILKASLGEKVIVRKKRNLWLYKHTRIHLDEVNDLGSFLELETVVKGINLMRAEEEHYKIIKLLSIDKFKKCNKSYSDLLLG